MQENKKYWIWLTRLIETVNLKTIYTLLNIYNKPEKIWNLTTKELQKNGISKNEIIEIRKIEYRQNLENYLYYMKKEKIDLITFIDEKYPQKLLNIENKPIAIYTRGNIDILNKFAIGIVGCRLCSNYGKLVAEEFSHKLALKDVVIVSGLARGIDTCSHIGCIKAK